ncbi:MAG: hypothetical protein L6Q66_10065 [Bacteroidia bacterium]|nr:hypothetical protein [Bacteroidia bacterium]
MKNRYLTPIVLAIFLSGCTTDDITVTVQGNAIMLPWSLPINNTMVFLQDENSRHHNKYYNRLETYTDNNGFYRFSNYFKQNAALTLGFIPNTYNTLVERSGTIQLKEGKQIINFNCYCYVQSQIQLIDSSLLVNPPDSIIFECINSIKNFKSKINNSFFSNPTNLYLNQIAGYPNTIECKVFRNGTYTKTDTIINPSSCNQSGQLYFNY